MGSNFCFKRIEHRQQIKVQVCFTEYKTPYELSMAAGLMQSCEHLFHFLNPLSLQVGFIYLSTNLICSRMKKPGSNGLEICNCLITSALRTLCLFTCGWT